VWDGFTALLVFLFIPSLVLTVMFYASTSVQNIFATIPIIANSPGFGQAQQVQNDFGIFDTMIPFLYFGTQIIILILASFLDVNPQTFVMGLLVNFFIIFVSFVISNTAHQILTLPVLSTSASHFPTMLLVLSNLPIFTAIFTGLYIVVILLRYYKTG